MVTLKYRLVGTDREMTKEFKTRTDCNDWISKQINIMVLEIESTGSAVYSRIFG